jgi:hypothetical protein
MNKRRSRSDDVLFISALTAILLGVALLLYTTGNFDAALAAWPVLVMAVGGGFLYIALVRGASFYFLFGGILFVLEGAFLLVSLLAGWNLAASWPLSMILAGIAGVISGLSAKKRFKAFFAVPSFGFIALGFLFSLFSFGFVQMKFRSFVAIWWPSLLIAGGISLFVAYGISRRSSSSSERGRGPTTGL